MIAIARCIELAFGTIMDKACKEVAYAPIHT